MNISSNLFKVEFSQLCFKINSPEIHFTTLLSIITIQIITMEQFGFNEHEPMIPLKERFWFSRTNTTWTRLLDRLLTSWSKLILQI